MRIIPVIFPKCDDRFRLDSAFVLSIYHPQARQPRTVTGSSANAVRSDRERGALRAIPLENKN